MVSERQLSFVTLTALVDLDETVAKSCLQRQIGGVKKGDDVDVGTIWVGCLATTLITIEVTAEDGTTKQYLHDHR